MGFRGQDCHLFHPVAVPSHKAYETSAFSQIGEEMMGKECVLLRIKVLLQKGQSVFGLIFHLWELHMGVPLKYGGLGNIVLG